MSGTVRQHRPPAYARVSVYVAYWPGREFRDQRIGLQRRYVYAMIDGDVEAARRIARTEAYYNTIAALGRVPWWLIKVIRWALAG